MPPLKKWINPELKTLALLDDEIWFPPVEEALEDGLLAMGGDLQPERLIRAYKNGIFPWFSGDVPLWWSPDPRFVLFPEELHISKSMKLLLKKNLFRFTKNADFETVMKCCAEVPRNGQSGTWITPSMLDAYMQLHTSGHAHSFEAWKGGDLAGGFYGIRMGNVFFGESMFTNLDNASKAIFIHAVKTMHEEGLKIIDCQTHSNHLASLGARLIDRKNFLKIIKENL